MLDTIGNTPLVELRRISPKPGVRIYAKLEGCSPTGSIKDRVALYLVRRAEEAGELRPGQTIVEASTGNTALALGLVAKLRGYQVKAVMPRQVVISKLGDLLALYGVEVIWCEPRAGMGGAIELASQLAQREGWYATRQFEDQANVLAHYETTGPEILGALSQVDAFVAGIGTGGTLMGVGRRLREHNPRVKVIGVEPRAGDVLQGLRNLSEGYVPPLLDLSQLDGRFLVDSATALALTRRLLQQEGIFAGISSGAALQGALRLAERMDRGNIVVIFADGGWKYLDALSQAERDRASQEELDNIAWW